MVQQSQSFESRLLEGIQEKAETAKWVGILLLVTGVLALVSPLFAGISITLMVGGLMILGGVSHCILAFSVGAFGRGVLVFLMGVLTAVAGLYMVSQPLASLAAMTLFLAAYFVAEGILELFAAFGARPSGGWGWLLMNAVVTLLLGLMIWRQFPLSGVWALGTLFGVKLLMSGAALVGVASAVGSGVKGVAARARS